MKVADELAKNRKSGPLRKPELKRSLRKISGPLACFRLSDSGKDAKVKGTRKVGGAGSPQIPPALFSWSRLLNSADLTISEPEIG